MKSDVRSSLGAGRDQPTALTSSCVMASREARKRPCKDGYLENHTFSASSPFAAALLLSPFLTSAPISCRPTLRTPQLKVPEAKSGESASQKECKGDEGQSAP